MHPDTDAIESFLARLSREPDLDAPELRAYDAADILLLQAAAELVPPDASERGSALDSFGVSGVPGAPGLSGASDLLSEDRSLAIIGDRQGALTLGAIEVLGARGVRVHQDPLLGERALDRNACRLLAEASDTCNARSRAQLYEHHPLGESLLAGSRFVLMQLPRSLAELDEIVWNIARFADPDVIVLAGGRDKHMSRAMNDVLARGFCEVRAGRGWRKARVLTARRPLPSVRSELSAQARFPVRGRDPELSFELAAFGATFGGATLDHGSRLLLRTLREQPPTTPRRIVDIGCGNGVLAVSAALAWPEAQVIASDQSAAAVAAARLTAQAAGVLADEDAGLHEPSGALPLGGSSFRSVPGVPGVPPVLSGQSVARGAHELREDGPAGEGVRGVQVVRADGSEAVPDGWADLVLLNPPFHTGAVVHAGVAHRLIRSTARALAPGAELRLVFNSHLGYRSLVQQVVGPVRQLARDKTFTVLAATRR